MASNKRTFVVSVGNLAMGGTGKTPFTVYLANMFMQDGYKTAILSLGYKGKLGYDTHVISDGETLLHHPPQAADEPYMMAMSLPSAVVITGKERTASFELAMQHYEPSVFILDDAFQHKRMHRDLNIVLLDHAKPLSTGFPFPFGYLREFPSALSRADIIMFTRATSTELPPKMAKYCKGKSVYFSEFVYKRFVHDGAELPVQKLEGQPVWLMSGIAHNSKLYEKMLTYAVKIRGHSKFNDHHKYTLKELDAVLRSADEAGASLIITTQKDFVKIPEQYRTRFAYPELGINILNQGFAEEVKRLAAKYLCS
jgi:tetraacyldisaccharide 4'-kinase